MYLRFVSVRYGKAHRMSVTREEEFGVLVPLKQKVLSWFAYDSRHPRQVLQYL